MTNGRLLRGARLERGLSIRAAAAAMGLHHSVLARAERGAIPAPSNALAIASFYGVSVLDVWPDDEGNEWPAT